ncbi:MAG TPA: hypothetical protein RMH85_00275 [Polyangiaceae bacterium LLY-WYZ-15_(1-7)]|nr:hypothetical protein [Sandaracinus sp.]HJK94193.1 hypothetical protein [Polyangiaceae bacterium LLY-WYZ-15_(1-7)]MBJ71584.1 hypothetical protein [Sandaracinus sp.]HJL03943.1 hypothetical protein [Polyangiaceae bacterium LLY-WYZ-15_(1-7)]HJL06894.1 hypothetical protein [Polyangiaceae bacterium LLY-WYZ-15_(1-7)]
MTLRRMTLRRMTLRRSALRRGALRRSALAALLALPVLGALPPSARADENDVPSCVEVSKEAPYQAYGYTHIVVVENSCDYPVKCDIATNVDPEPVERRVDASETERVATRRGSPAREFQTRVTCRRD